jgi:hypothetical protein
MCRLGAATRRTAPRRGRSGDARARAPPLKLVMTHATSRSQRSKRRGHHAFTGQARMRTSATRHALRNCYKLSFQEEAVRQSGGASERRAAPRLVAVGLLEDHSASVGDRDLLHQCEEPRSRCPCRSRSRRPTGKHVSGTVGECAGGTAAVPVAFCAEAEGSVGELDDAVGRVAVATAGALSGALLVPKRT